MRQEADVARNAQTQNVIDEILRRLAAGEPVTEDLLETIPKGRRISVPITIGQNDGTNEYATVWIDNAEDGPRITVEKHSAH